MIKPLTSFRLMALLCVLTSFSGINITLADELHVDLSQSNHVQFISDAPVEKFVGATSKVDGYVQWQGREWTQDSEVYLEVALETLETGIGLRNRHLRENYLETKTFPYAQYKGRIIKSACPDSSADLVPTCTITTQGQLSIHGQEQPVTVTVDVQKTGTNYHAQTWFSVKLSDYKIKIPSIMFYKINETMELYLDVFFKRASE